MKEKQEEISQDNFIRDFTDRIVNGPGGFKRWEDGEYVIFKDRDLGIAEFVINCLSNTLCEGSEEVIKIIQQRRSE